MDVMRIIREDQVIAVIRAREIADPGGLAATLMDVGIRCVEFTLTTPGALQALREASDVGAVGGVGTVRSPEQAASAVEAGARFVVTPILSEEIVAAVPSDVPVVVGAFSPSEVHRATTSGAAGVKLFPARIGGAAYVRDLLGPFPEVDLIPSGGIDSDNAAGFIEAGSPAVFAGSSIVPPSAVERAEHADIRERAARLMAGLDP